MQARQIIELTNQNLEIFPLSFGRDNVVFIIVYGVDDTTKE